MFLQQDEPRSYARIRYRLLIVDIVGSLLFLAAVQYSGASYAIAIWWSHRFKSLAFVIAGYLAVIGAAYYMVMLPLHFYGTFLLEHRFGLSRLSLSGWLKKEAKHVTLSVLLSGALIEGLYALLRNSPNQWPTLATIGWIMVSVILARIFPTVLLPIFYKTVPLEDELLVKRLLGLCQRVGIRALGVFRFDLGVETRKANAALAGLGKTRRVLVSDTLVKDFSADEIEGVLAHELGHQRFRHILKLLVISAVGSWVAFSLINVTALWWVDALNLSSIADIAGFPMFMLSLSALGLIGLPMQNLLSRHFEWQADRFAVKTTSAPLAYADALRKLERLNLADPSPPRWIVWIFYDHPPITERIRAAERTNINHVGSGFRAEGSG